jgi:hypothetical protein
VADRSGNRALDELIEAFLDEEVETPRAGRVPVRHLANPEIAAGACRLVSQSFRLFARGRGLTLDVKDTTPNRCGYQNRPVTGVAAHTVNRLPRGAVSVNIDFTASQYGYSELPLISFRNPSDGSWQQEALAA